MANDETAENERAVIGGNSPPPETLEEMHKEWLAIVQGLAEAGMKLPSEVKNEEDVGAIAAHINVTRRKVQDLDDKRKGETAPLRQQVEDINAFFNAMIDRLKKMTSILGSRVTVYQDKLAEEERRRRAEIAAREREEAKRKLEAAAEAKTGIEGEIAQFTAEKAHDRATHYEESARGSDAEMARMRTAGGTVSSRTSLDFRVAEYSKIDMRELRESFSVADIDKAIRAHIRKHKKTKPLKGVEIFETSKAAFRG